MKDFGTHVSPKLTPNQIGSAVDNGSLSCRQSSTNGDSALSRPDTVPASDDGTLVTLTEFNARGEAYKTTDPAGTQSRVVVDHAGRQTKTIQHYVDGDPTSGNTDADVTVEYTYNQDGRIATIKARQASTGADQVTTYTYGVRTGTGSTLNSNDLLAKVTYPDSADSTDNVSYQYNRQGQVISVTDQRGNVHSYDYDKLGRLTQDRVTTLASGTDGTVKRIATSYDDLDHRYQITSYDNATVGSGSVGNQVQLSTNPLVGILEGIVQEHSGHTTVNTPYVMVTLDTTAASGEFTKGLRIQSLNYPGSGGTARQILFTYGSSGSDADNLNRVDAIKDNVGGTPPTLVSYTYLGLGTAVIADYQEPDIKLDLFGGTSGSYAGLDRFDRVQDQRWIKYSGTPSDAARIKHGYDRAGNRLWREDAVAAANGKNFDELYAYDGIYRLSDLQRGNLNTSDDGIVSGSLNFRHNWTLDPLGNWSEFKEDASGDGTFELDQTRTVNKANEITGISGGSWVTPAYDRSGNMTTMPQPAAPTSSYTATYDAWNRLMSLTDGSNTVAEYQYDGQNWRTITKSYSGGTLSETRHHYYSQQWQCLEEKVGTSTLTLDRQFVWGLRYVDDLVLRDRDTDANGSLDERLYALQDANWNVIALTDTSGAIQERYVYQAYGTPVILTGSFGSRSSSSYDWETRYAGYFWDKASGLFHIRNRDFQSILGSWIERDPIEYLEAMNLYEYIRARPTGATDPYGLFLEQLGITVGVGRCCYGCIPASWLARLIPQLAPFSWLLNFLCICLELCFKGDLFNCCQGNQRTSRFRLEVCLTLTIRLCKSLDMGGKLIRCTPKDRGIGRGGGLGFPAGGTWGQCPPTGCHGRLCLQGSFGWDYGRWTGYSYASYGFRTCYTPANGTWQTEVGRGIGGPGTGGGGGGCWTCISQKLF